MKVSIVKVRRMLAEAAASTGMHMTMGGEIVPFGCPECVADIEDRITDASYSRDACHRGTAARSHYNGVLNDLRMKKRAALKAPDSPGDTKVQLKITAPVDDDFDDSDEVKSLVDGLLDDEHSEGVAAPEHFDTTLEDPAEEELLRTVISKMVDKK